MRFIGQKYIVFNVIKAILWSCASLFIGMCSVLYFSPHGITSCPMVSGCHTLYDFIAGMLFITICVLMGPRKLWFIVLALPVLVFISQLEEFRTGEAINSVSWFINTLPNDPLFQGGVLAVIFAIGFYALKKIHT